MVGFVCVVVFFGCVAECLCDCMVVWLCGFGVVWLYGCVFVLMCVCILLSANSFACLCFIVVCIYEMVFEFEQSDESE